MNRGPAGQESDVVIEIVDGKLVVMGHLPTAADGLGKSLSSTNFQALAANLSQSGAATAASGASSVGNPSAAPKK
jgi:hypothetical protein